MKEDKAADTGVYRNGCNTKHLQLLED